MLRRLKECDLEDHAARHGTNLPALRNRSTAILRTSLFNSLQGRADYRTDAMATFAILLTQWTEEYVAYKNEREINSSNVLAGPENVMTPPEEQCSRPRFNRTDSFQMGFEEVFEHGHDDRVLFPINEVVSRESPGPLTPKTEDWLATGERRSLSPHIQSDPDPNNTPKASNKGRTLKTDHTKPYFLVCFGRDLEKFLKERNGSSIHSFISELTQDDVLTEAGVQEHLRQYYLGLLRFAGDCPWKDIRLSCDKLVRRVEKLGADLPQQHFKGVYSPSFFIPVRDTIGLDDDLEFYFPSHDTDELPDSSSYSSKKDTDPSRTDNFEPPFSSRFSSIPETSSVGIGLLGTSFQAPESPRLTKKGKQNSASSFGSFRSIKKSSFAHGYSGFLYPANNLPMPFSPPSGLTMSMPKSRAKYRSYSKASHLPRIPSRAAMDVHNAYYKMYGRVGNIFKILTVAPQFAITTKNFTEEFLGYNVQFLLPYSFRIYMGIMAAAEMKSQYIFGLTTEYYSSHHTRGPAEWLQGLGHAPAQLRGLAKWNALLAHEPWAIKNHHIQELVTLKWQWHEVILSTMIMAYYHSWSAFALACGVVPEVDLPGGLAKPSKKPNFAGRVPASPSLSKVPLSTSANLERGRKEETSPGTSVRSRKRQTQGTGDETNQDESLHVPDKWLKTPHGSVPNSPRPKSPGEWEQDKSKAPSIKSRGQTTESVFSNDTFDTAQEEIRGRRRSFDDCTASDGGLQSSELAGSDLAPASSLPTSPWLTPAWVYDVSPVSSLSSYITNTTNQSSVQHTLPMNVPIEGHEKFLHPDSLKAKIKEFDVHNKEYSFVDETLFSFNDTGSTVTGLINGHFDGLDKVLDKYFKAAEHADLDGCVAFEDIARKMGARLGLLSRSSSSINLSASTNPHPDSPSWGPPTLPRNDSFPTRFGLFGLRESDNQTREPDDSADQDYKFDFGSEGSHTPQQWGENFPDSPSSHRHSRTSSVNWAPDRGYPVKEAVWAYALRMLGFQKVSYPYREIKMLIGKSTRRFIKRLVIVPHLMTIADWNGSAVVEPENEEGVSMTKMSSDEKVMIAIYASQARFQGEIIVALNALSKHRQTERWC